MPSFVQRFDDNAKAKLQWENTKLADFISDVGLVSAYVAPVVIVMDEESGGAQDKKLLAFASVHFVNHLLTDNVKLHVGRMRPNGENTRSFFSGHTSTSFTSAAYLCSVYRDDRTRCVLGLGVATATGYLRIAAGKHWASDVITGLLAGSLMGSSAPIFVRGF